MSVARLYTVNHTLAMPGPLDWRPFFRILRELFDNVTYIRNLTDVDDKIIVESDRLGVDINTLTEDITRVYQANMLKLNMLKPTHEPKVTENINNIIDTVQKIINNKSAYISENHVFLIWNPLVSMVLYQIKSLKI